MSWKALLSLPLPYKLQATPPPPYPTPHLISLPTPVQESCGLQANADDEATSPPKEANAREGAQANQQPKHGKGKFADARALQQQLKCEQENVRRLEARLEDSQRTSEYHRLVRACCAE